MLIFHFRFKKKYLDAVENFVHGISIGNTVAAVVVFSFFYVVVILVKVVVVVPCEHRVVTSPVLRRSAKS